MNIKINLIGLGMVALGILSAAVTGVFLPILQPAAAVLALVGVFVFGASFCEKAVIDYITFENNEFVFSVRKKKYYNFFPFSIALSVFQADINFLYKIEYYRYTAPSMEAEDEEIVAVAISRAEYKNLVENQKQQYLDKKAPRDMVEYICHPKRVKLKWAKAKYIICAVLSALCLTGLTVPADILLALSMVALFAVLAVLFRIGYKKAKFKSDIYNSYFGEHKEDGLC